MAYRITISQSFSTQVIVNGGKLTPDLIQLAAREAEREAAWEPDGVPLLCEVSDTETGVILDTDDLNLYGTSVEHARA